MLRLKLIPLLKLERSTKLKHEPLSDNDDGLEEYFEKEVKSEVDSDIDHV